jgi:tetratricopeptide (TPR) repeat protein
VPLFRQIKMSKKEKPVAAPEVAIENALNKGEKFIEKNGKKLLIGIGVVALMFGAYYAYNGLYRAPMVKRALTDMYQAQEQFARDSFALALRGNSSFKGFEDVATEYSSTDQGNLAKHYAGICCLYLKEYQKALDHFKGFSTVSGHVGELLTAQNLGLMGDALVELGDKEQALKKYEEAANYKPNGDTTPRYLKKAALLNIEAGKSKEAIAQLQRIKFEFPSQDMDIDNLIAAAEQKL